MNLLNQLELDIMLHLLPLVLVYLVDNWNVENTRPYVLY